MTFKKILCPLDFSPGSQHAMRVAVRLAADFGAELVLAHVWHVPPFAFGGGDPFPAEAIQRMIEDEERGLAAATDDAVKLGAQRVTSRFLTGVPWDQIVETLGRDDAFDLVVMGTHGRTGLARVLLGSVTEKVIRHAPCSVLAARPGSDGASFAHVLCPIDFSDSSRHAVMRAAELAAPSGAGIALLHVIEIPITYTSEPSASDFLEGIEQRSTHLLEQWADDLRAKVSVPVTAEIRIGRPGVQTLAVLEQDPTFDLVAMGSHGRTGLRHVVLGSVAEKVVRHAACPVLVARARGAYAYAVNDVR
jgi:nucleotide-binding universal stress UspA family protein